ncbi:hypothetical protein ACIBH1_45110 [Nonomuraea sp. NPDC050663]|uniref:hypothetical protein n=1 Tax=Nonomuraea sp. NPDC050663 TaxID=3364370 RepID=UPI0037BD563F
MVKRTFKEGVPAAQINAAVKAAAVRGLRLAGKHLVKAARDRVPLDQGTLERSIKESVDETRLIGAVSADTPYALIQHEVPPPPDTDEKGRSYTHDPGRTWKYLEEPHREQATVMRDIIAAQLKKVLFGKGGL